MADQSAGEAAKGRAGLANTGRVKGVEAPTRHFNFRRVDPRRFRFLTDNDELAVMIIDVTNIAKKKGCTCDLFIPKELSS